ncbi:hypothetical protein [Konateibacter massiliensis]|uniref:hypothetical protein n=1 Tax=Konateibacter massiliensis TaxID=2002841 RepID=UPI0015D4B221|nr:hypothetical protein [Konateibacter massiliensis]
MDQNNSASPQTGSILYLENAFVEEVTANDDGTGSILVSYDVETFDHTIQQESLLLNIGRNTVIMNEFAQPISISDLEMGMTVDAAFSSAMTMSIPPQSRAFQIVVRPETPNTAITTDRVIGADIANNFLFTGNPYDMMDQMRFSISDATVITDRLGNRISLSQIEPGQLVEIEHATFQTMSIPPQTTAFRIQVLS